MDALKEANKRAHELVKSRRPELTVDELIDKLAGLKTRINEIEQQLFLTQQEYDAVKAELREATKRDILQGTADGND